MLAKTFLLGALLARSLASDDTKSSAYGSESTVEDLAEYEGPDNPPNTLAIWNPNVRTAAVNSTWMIIPVNKTAVEKAIYPYELLPLPEAVFPEGFPNDTHPVIAQIGYQNDIRQFELLAIDKLMAGSLLVPFVDRLNNGATPFIYPLDNWIGGVDNDLEGVVPAVVSTLEGTTVDIVDFNPSGPAYSEVDEGTYSARTQEVIVPNSLSGPGLQPELVDMLFVEDPLPMYTNHTFHTLLNQPQLLGILGLYRCFRNAIYFNETFSQPTFRIGNVTLYNALGYEGFAGVYENVQGFSATGEEIGFAAQNCSTAAEDVDPMASA